MTEAQKKAQLTVSGGPAYLCRVEPHGWEGEQPLA